MPAMIAMTATTTSSSISENPRDEGSPLTPLTAARTRSPVRPRFEERIEGGDDFSDRTLSLRRW
jgi:hypothetical protein